MESQYFFILVTFIVLGSLNIEMYVALNLLSAAPILDMCNILGSIAALVTTVLCF